MKPQLLAEPLAALIRPDDEQSHEAEAAAIGDYRSAADQLATLLGGDKPLRVRIPEYLCIVAAGIPAFVCRPRPPPPGNRQAPPSSREWKGEAPPGGSAVCGAVIPGPRA